MENWRRFLIEQGAVPALPGVGVHGLSPSRTPKARIVVKARALTGWEKFLRKLRKVPGPGKKLYALFSSVSLAKGAKKAYTEGYFNIEKNKKYEPGLQALAEYAANEGIVDALPGIGEVIDIYDWLSDQFD